VPFRRHRAERVAMQSVDRLPVDVPPRHARLRRGGPRTPLPLVPLIAVGAGIGIAYVSQSAHATEATYEASNLAAQQQVLLSQASQLNDELARLESSERIVGAAQALGMRPASRWAYVTTAHPVQVIPVSPTPETASTTPGGSQQIIGALGGAAGTDGSAP
jgi:mannitol-1-phosphate/altronate dehydrogenase